MQLTKTCLSLGLAMGISQFAFADWVDDAATKVEQHTI